MPASEEDRQWPRPAVQTPDGPKQPDRVSVVICAVTADRWDHTLAAVDSVRGQSVPPEEIIVVVDHNPALWRRLRTALPDVTVRQSQGRPGLSGAKNTGIAASRGEIVAFLDDGAVAEADWLKYLADAYHDRSVVGVGGLTLPRWQDARPSWFPRELDWVVGCTCTGMPRDRAAVRNLPGGNASFRREAFTVAGDFLSGIGRSAMGPRSGCEDTEFCIRLLRRMPGSRLLFDDRAVSWHQVAPARARFRYLTARCYAEGQSRAGLGDGLSAGRGYAARTLPAGVRRGLADLGAGDPAGLGRAAAIVAGLTAAAAGYTVGATRELAAGVLAGKVRALAAAWRPEW
jgi:hypothetical protein